MVLATCFALSMSAQSKAPSAPNPNKNLETLLSAYQFRSIGPAVTSGRVIDLAINPNNKFEWYVAAANGGVWKTNNAGVSFSPIFDGQGVFSIGCLKMDPLNTNVLWVGSGENNNQRSVGYGDGVYKTIDGGQTWQNMGLKNSEHIGMIAVDPVQTNTVYVAAYGPLWSAGGDRGIYKTTDGGKSWNRVLYVSENTGFNEVHIHPKYSNILYATAHQRRRHEWTYVGGGPESAIYKSEDYGQTWTKLQTGLPAGDVGRISLAVSPVETDWVYALIEAEGNDGGLYASTNRGASFEKRSGHFTAGNYYQELFADPVNPLVIYSMNTWAQISTDGGRSFKGIGENNKHVDNHVIWVDPSNTKHFLMGCDGGLYETFDAAAHWDYKANLPITQFYRVTVDNEKPFYNIYGGTQDNNTLGGPSRTTSASGIHNYNWFVTVGGDGFKTVVDPNDPNTVYSQWQYGGLIRFNKKTGEAFDIKPQEKPGEAAYKFNWDAPIVISHHNPSTLYFAAQNVFKSNDKGQTWEVISPDLSRGIDRNKLPVMGKVWSMDAVAKNQSTSMYGNITALAESPLNSNILIAGTDDGLIHITADGGKNWQKYESFPGVPKNTLVQNVYVSKHSYAIYAVFNNHRNGDFKPYLLKSEDLGKTWVAIQNDLPNRGTVNCFTEDHKNKQLMFVGTDFGLFVSVNAGKHWQAFKSGLPPTTIKEIAIQERENDLVLATFGRGFYVLDDYSLLQTFDAQSERINQSPISILPIKDALVYIPSTPLGHKGKSFQGESFYTAENPAIGATIYIHVRDDYSSLQSQRTEREKTSINDFYPSKDSIRMEQNELESFLWVMIKDAQGNVVRQFKRPISKGINKLVWNGRYDKTSPITFYVPDPNNPYEGDDQGALAMPGKYTIQCLIVKDLKVVTNSESQTFELQSLYPITSDPKFNQKLADFRAVVLGVNQYMDHLNNKMSFIKQGMNQLASVSYLNNISEIERLTHDIQLKLHGDGALASREFEVLPGLVGALEGIVGGLWSTSQTPSTTYLNKFDQIQIDFTPVYEQVKQLDEKVKALEQLLNDSKFPYTPGRLPAWSK
ncbi:MAG: hypothetical protein RLZZ60_1480 [Bacteroidota bacterium]